MSLTDKGYIDAADFGFDVLNTGANNATSVFNAIIEANGLPVLVFAKSDFFLDKIEINNIPIDLRFSGVGRINRSSSNASVLEVRRTFENIKPITGFSRKSVTIDGTSTDVTVLAVANAGTYFLRGDVIKVVSDDQDTDASDATSDPANARRRGEFAVVAGTSGNELWIAGRLEDYGLYVINPRVGRMPRMLTKVKMPEVLGNISNENTIYFFTNCWCPEVDITVWNHGGIVIGSSSSYCGKWYLKGSGKGTVSKSLGYLFNDISGQSNEVNRPIGYFFRHVTTTNFNLIPANKDSLASYGATRDHTVIGGLALSSQGSPWDDHAGARRSRWIDCEARGSLKNTSTKRVGFQCRARNSEIINPKVDSSFDALAYVAEKTSGTLTIRGGEWFCNTIMDEKKTLRNNLTIYIYDGNGSVDGGTVVLWGADECPQCDVHLYGGRYGFNKLTSANDYSQFCTMKNGSLFLHDTNLFVVNGDNPALNFRAFYASGTEAVKIYGKFNLKLGPSSTLKYILTSSNALAECLVKIVLTQGSVNPSSLSGSAAKVKYVMVGTSVKSNVSDFAGYLDLAGI